MTIRRPRRPLSLRARVVSAMALVAVVLAVVAVTITAMTRAELVDQIDARLVDGSAGDRGGLFALQDDDDDDDEGRTVERRRLVPLERQSDFYEGVVDADGRLRTFFVPNIGGEDSSPPDLAGETIELDRSGLSFFTVDATEGSLHYRVLARAGDDGSVVLTALPLNDVEATISRLVRVEILGVAAILAVLALVTWWMLRLGVRPVKAMTTTATAIAAGDLSARIDESSPAAESRELATALNAMLATIESAFDERARSEGRLRRFVADASHELRTPVTTIRGYAELYRMGGLTDPDSLDDAMRRTEDEARRMSRLVEEMLTLAKLDDERPMDHSPVDLVRLALDAGADARVVAPDRAISVETCDAAIVRGDEDRLRQVVANLVTNAIVHTDAPATITIRVSTDEADHAVVEVADTGAGMPDDVADRATERFFRADPSRARRRGGSGLGLAIVESTVESHGGSLVVDSAPGVGTTMRIVLPSAR